MCDPAHYAPLAIAAEECGFASMTIPDSLCYPEVSESLYPYTPDGNREFLDGKPFLDPFALIAALGAVTERLRFNTFVLKLPIRQPVLVAKQATSVAVMTGNRLGLGVGLSPWPEDFAVTGQEWKARGRRTDEMIEIIRGLTGGAYFAHTGEFYEIPSVKLCPIPSAPIPILVGGHSGPALRRAARLGDGWMHAGGGEETLAEMIQRVQALRREYGREREAFEIHAISLDAYSLDGVRRIEDMGVTDAIVGFRNAYETDTTPLGQKLDAVRAYADRIISRL